MVESILPLLIVTSAQAPAEEVLKQWPEVQLRTVEEAIDLADAAYLVTVHFFDTKTDDSNSNLVETSVRIVAERALWGELPFQSLRPPRREFRVGPLTMGNNYNPWNLLGPTVPSRRLVLLSSGSGPDLRIVHVIFQARQDEEWPPIDDLLSVRELENKKDSAALREQLVEAAVDPNSSDLLWQYALRRLYLLEDDPNRRFDLIMNPRLLESDWKQMRLWYARTLLIGPGPSEADVRERRISRDELRVVFERLLQTFETTTSPDMAATALNSFSDGTAKAMEYTDQEWSQIRARIRAAVENPEHPFHKLPADRQATTQRDIDRVLREPNPFAPEK